MRQRGQKVTKGQEIPSSIQNRAFEHFGHGDYRTQKKIVIKQRNQLIGEDEFLNQPVESFVGQEQIQGSNQVQNQRIQNNYSAQSDQNVRFTERGKNMSVNSMFAGNQSLAKRKNERRSHQVKFEDDVASAAPVIGQNQAMEVIQSENRSSSIEPSNLSNQYYERQQRLKQQFQAQNFNNNNGEQYPENENVQYEYYEEGPGGEQVYYDEQAYYDHGYFNNDPGIVYEEIQDQGLDQVQYYDDGQYQQNYGDEYYDEFSNQVQQDAQLLNDFHQNTHFDLQPVQMQNQQLIFNHEGPNIAQFQNQQNFEMAQVNVSASSPQMNKVQQIKSSHVKQIGENQQVKIESNVSVQQTATMPPKQIVQTQSKQSSQIVTGGQVQSQVNMQVAQQSMQKSAQVIQSSGQSAIAQQVSSQAGPAAKIATSSAQVVTKQASIQGGASAQITLVKTEAAAQKAGVKVEATKEAKAQIKKSGVNDIGLEGENINSTNLTKKQEWAVNRVNKLAFKEVGESETKTKSVPMRGHLQQRATLQQKKSAVNDIGLEVDFNQAQASAKVGQKQSPMKIEQMKKTAVKVDLKASGPQMDYKIEKFDFSAHLKMSKQHIEETSQFDHHQKGLYSQAQSQNKESLKVKAAKEESESFFTEQELNQQHNSQFYKSLNEGKAFNQNQNQQMQEIDLSDVKDLRNFQQPKESSREDGKVASKSFQNGAAQVSQLGSGASEQAISKVGYGSGQSKSQQYQTGSSGQGENEFVNLNGGQALCVQTENKYQIKSGQQRQYIERIEEVDEINEETAVVHESIKASSYEDNQQQQQSKKNGIKAEINLEKHIKATSCTLEGDELVLIDGALKIQSGYAASGSGAAHGGIEMKASSYEMKMQSSGGAMIMGTQSSGGAIMMETQAIAAKSSAVGGAMMTKTQVRGQSTTIMGAQGGGSSMMMGTYGGGGKGSYELNYMNAQIKGQSEVPLYIDATGGGAPQGVDPAMWKAITLSNFQYQQNPYHKSVNSDNQSCFKTQAAYHNYQYNVEFVLPDIDYIEASKQESAHHSQSVFFQAQQTQSMSASYQYETHYLEDDNFEICSEGEPEELPADKVFIEVTTVTTSFKMNAAQLQQQRQMRAAQMQQTASSSYQIVGGQQQQASMVMKGQASIGMQQQASHGVKQQASFGMNQQVVSGGQITMNQGMAGASYATSQAMQAQASGFAAIQGSTYGEAGAMSGYAEAGASGNMAISSSNQIMGGHLAQDQGETNENTFFDGDTEYFYGEDGQLYKYVYEMVTVDAPIEEAVEDQYGDEYGLELEYTEHAYIQEYEDDLSFDKDSFVHYEPDPDFDGEMDQEIGQIEQYYDQEAYYGDEQAHYGDEQDQIVDQVGRAPQRIGKTVTFAQENYDPITMPASGRPPLANNRSQSMSGSGSSNQSNVYGHDLYTQLKVVKTNLNNLKDFRGINRLKRPPVFAWTQLSHTEQKKRSLSASSRDNEKNISFFQERVQLNPQDQLLDSASLKLITVTYNMAGSVPSKEDIDKLFQKENITHDICVLASQEAERPIAYSLLNDSKEKLNNVIKQYFGVEGKSIAERDGVNLKPDDLRRISQKAKRSSTAGPRFKGPSVRIDSFGTDSLETQGNDKYVVVHYVTLAAISLIILVKEKYEDLITDIRTDSLALGHFGIVANKGAICISMDIAQKKVLFINCHLEAHEENREKRNQQLTQICQRFLLDGQDGSPQDDEAIKHVNSTWDAIIWLGDFNSRIQGYAQEDPNTGKMQKQTASTINGIYEDRFEDIFKKDQMLIDAKEHNLAKFGFKEGHPEMWAPTFKLKQVKGDKKAGNEVEYATKRTPSWVDRVLYMSNNKETKQAPLLKGSQVTFREFSKEAPERKNDRQDLDLEKIDTLTCVNQDSNNLLFLSDHKPVFAQFYLKINNYSVRKTAIVQNQPRGREMPTTNTRNKADRQLEMPKMKKNQSVNVLNRQ